MLPATIRQDGRYTSLKTLAAEQSTRVRGLADNDENKVAILFVYELESSAFYFTTGYFTSLRRAVTYSRAIFQNEDISVKIFSNNKLFPNIKGVMLKGNRLTVTMSGKVNVVELRDGADARCEIHFTDHEKTAVINSAQLLIIADIYGDDTDNWRGKRIALYGEEGTWFGKHQWGIRVDEKMTRAASKQPPSKAPQQVQTGRSKSVAREVKAPARNGTAVHKPNTNEIDARAWLEGEIMDGVTRLSLVIDALIMADLCQSPSEALESLGEYQFPAGFKLQDSQAVKSEGAFKIFDWMVARKETAETEAALNAENHDALGAE